MTYGDYEFSPVPLMSISKEIIKTGDGRNLSELFSINLAGSLVIIDGSGSIVTIDGLQDDLMAAMSGDGELLEVKCDDEVLLQCYPRIKNVNIQSGVWVFKSDYSIDLEFDEIAPGSGNNFLSSASEEWQVEFAEDKAYHTWNLPDGSTDTLPYQLRLTHTLNATGRSHYEDNGLEKLAWEEAREWVIDRLGYDDTYVGNSSVFNLNTALFAPYNHVRTTSIGETDGTFSVTESWLVINSGEGIAGHALEDYNIELRRSADNGLTSIGINGTIQGLESRDYGSNSGDFAITETKYDAAVDYWGVVKNRLYGRAGMILNAEPRTVGGCGNRNININPLSQSAGHNPSTGTITYSYEYNDRPSNCVANSISESITVTDNNPTDIFANLTVLGKANGPVLQDIGTQTAFTRDLSIEVVMGCPASGCPSNATNVGLLLAQRPTSEVNNIVTAFEDDLQDAYNQVFRTQDNISWNPKEGRYSRNVSWIAGGC